MTLVICQWGSRGEMLIDSSSNIGASQLTASIGQFHWILAAGGDSDS